MMLPLPINLLLLNFLFQSTKSSTCTLLQRRWKSINVIASAGELEKVHDDQQAERFGWGWGREETENFLYEEKKRTAVEKGIDPTSVKMPNRDTTNAYLSTLESMPRDIPTKILKCYRHFKWYGNPNRADLQHHWSLFAYNSNITRCLEIIGIAGNIMSNPETALIGDSLLWSKGIGQYPLMMTTDRGWTEIF